MQKGNGVRALMLSLIGLAMIIFIPWLCVKSVSSAMNYLRNGTEVQCRVVSVEEHKSGKVPCTPFIQMIQARKYWLRRL